jgi:hypothetical protein
MRALTIRQPWASLVACGAKTIATRSWKTSYRGDLLIHAGKVAETGEVGPYNVEKDNPRGTSPAYLLRGDSLSWPYRLPLGAVVAVARLADVVPIVDGETADNDGTPRVESYVDDGDFPDGWLDVYHPTLGNPINPEGSGRSIPEQAPLGDFTPGRFAWLLTDVVRLAEPIPAKGRQGLWTPDADLVQDLVLAPHVLQGNAR